MMVLVQEKNGYHRGVWRQQLWQEPSRFPAFRFLAPYSTLKGQSWSLNRVRLSSLVLGNLLLEGNVPEMIRKCVNVDLALVLL